MYRNVILALVGWLILGNASVGPSGTARPPEDAQHSQGSPAPQRAGAPSQPKYAPHPDRYSDDCHRAQKYDVAELCAQWRASYAAEEAVEAARTGNLIAGAGAFLSFLSVVLVLLALRQGREANQIASETAKQQLRAYVAVKGLAQWFVDTNDPIIKISYENSGQTPAVVLRSFNRIYALPKGKKPPLPQPEQIVTGVYRVGHGGEHQWEQHYARELRKGQLEKLRADKLVLWVVGVLAYKDIFGQWHVFRHAHHGIIPQMTRTTMSAIYQLETLGEREEGFDPSKAWPFSTARPLGAKA